MKLNSDPIRNSLIFALFLGTIAGAAQKTAMPGQRTDQTSAILNSGFETGNLKGWKHWQSKRCQVGANAYRGQYALEVGPERGLCSQEIKIQPNSRYRLSAYLKTSSGAEEVQLILSEYGGVKLSISTALTEYTQLSLEFNSASTVDQALVTIYHPHGQGKGYADQLELLYLGEAPAPTVQEFVPLQVRTLHEEGGVTQKSDDEMQWFVDAKFGMFIHWGVYAAMDEGNEWVMHNEAHSPEAYRARAEDSEEGFTASRFDPAQWAELAKTAGMKYMVLTARHHDGYALFESRHPNRWTSVEHLGRNLIQEYVQAVRAADLHVGLYYSPMSWRYPGYYDVSGTDCKPNVWGYTTESWHKENARVMKEEVYEQITALLSEYGPIEYMFWDGAWLGQSVQPEMERRFWDSGKYQNPASEWPIADEYVVRDADSDQALGVMGLVRKYQPHLIVNDRFSWIGDVEPEEGGAATAGPIRAHPMEKCMTLMKGGWGYFPNRPTYRFEEIAVHFSNCLVRNVNFLLNVSPDRHGVIPDNQKEVLHQIGDWLNHVGEAVYDTRAGPWQPLFGEYGFTWKDNKIYCHIYAGYRGVDAQEFITHSIGLRKVLEVKNLSNGKAQKWGRNPDDTVTIKAIDYQPDDAVTILEITLDQRVYD
jgi:alpha-L-fucosidase